MRRIYVHVICAVIGLTACCTVEIFAQTQKTQKAIPANKVYVNDTKELKDALAAAKPGDSILLKDGIYSGKFVIPSTASGTARRAIVLTGSRKAILDAGSTTTGYVLSLQANYWRIRGITVTNGLKGIVTDGASYNLIDDVLVTKMGEEGVHFRSFSKHNILQRSEISYTGLKTPDFGEGVYIGSANSNWGKYSNGEPDKCDSNKVLNNKIGPYIAAECIDIKEGTTGGIISGNTFEAQGITGANSADSWLDVKGNYYLIENNRGNNTKPSMLKDGYQVNCAFVGWGSYNVFKSNISDVNAAGYGFMINLKSSKGEAIGNKVYSDNQVKNAESGVANIPLTE